ncbi:Sec-independent protein translocase protein TatB [Phyllobacterium lublinensis]|uniref:Sec-independent protein translocase protein TatB n=1 Tax=Phyllobacterium lublinensis TaxID=2875708 RepID=UPI001CCCFFED|nr:Sec-independent protein translocase protein TatB [Phyllobacterium sp. 2063]MBZ9653600.1 Sec-independent protein translocase protein TatB [Phyllobacterium sp. 2063]
MFEVGWSEILVIVIVLIVVVGPKDLPKMLRAFGKATTKFRATAGEFRRQFDEALKEAELDDVRDIINDAKSLDPRSDIRKVFDPVRTIGEEIRSSLKDATATARENVAIPDPEAPGATQLQPQVMEPISAAAVEKVAPAKATPSKPKAPAAKKAAAPKTTTADKPAKSPAKRTAKPRSKTGDTGIES